MKIYIAIIPFALTTACATGPNNIYGGAFGQPVTGNEVSVTVSNIWNQADAFPLAERHCREHNRAARFNQFKDGHASFDCVKPD